jgi:OPA family glycerol-3-phosphate transporter-like MFS transporter
MEYLVDKLLPVGILLAVIAVVIVRLPSVELGHSAAYKRRRVTNWLPVGLLYSFLYMGRYNLTVAKDAFGDLMTNADFGLIFGIGTAVYGSAFIINGPLTDRVGGKRALLIGGAGSLLANAAMGLPPLLGVEDDLVTVYSLLYGVNMYFQSFGAVAIVKINAPWFHVHERGVFGAIFGILISLGIYFAFDWGGMIVDELPVQWVFFIPAMLLLVLWVIVVTWVKNTPGEAGFDDFDTADASSGDDGPSLSTREVFSKMLRNPVIMTIACIEFCSGFLRQAIMQWYKTIMKQTGLSEDNFVYENWGLLLCCAGILGGVMAGIISDRVFGSRRGPVAGLLYGLMLIGGIVLVFVMETPALGWVVVFMSMCVIGVHGMLSGTASMDFGGRRNAGVAVGIIDGFVYAGTAVMSFTYKAILPSEAPESTVLGNYSAWPIAMVPVAILGLLLALRVWNAKPKASAAS